MSHVLSHALSMTRTAVVRGTHAAATHELQKLHTMDIRGELGREIVLLRAVLACRTRDEAEVRSAVNELRSVTPEEVASVMDMLSRAPESRDPSYAALARRVATSLGRAPQLPERGRIAGWVAVSTGAAAWVGWALYFFMFAVRSSQQGEMSPEQGAQFGAHPLMSAIILSVLGASVSGVIAGIVAVRRTRTHKPLAILGLLASSLALLLMIVIMAAELALLIPTSDNR